MQINENIQPNFLKHFILAFNSNSINLFAKSNCKILGTLRKIMFEHVKVLFSAKVWDYISLQMPDTVFFCLIFYTVSTAFVLIISQINLFEPVVTTLNYRITTAPKSKLVFKSLYFKCKWPSYPGNLLKYFNRMFQWNLQHTCSEHGIWDKTVYKFCWHSFISMTYCEIIIFYVRICVFGCTFLIDTWFTGRMR